MTTKHALNYGMVYLPNGCMMKEGYLERWEYYENSATLVFVDGVIVKASVNAIYLLHKDEEGS